MTTTLIVLVAAALLVAAPLTVRAEFLAALRTVPVV
jgi:hypothetical protein